MGRVPKGEKAFHGLFNGLMREIKQRFSDFGRDWLILWIYIISLTIGGPKAVYMFSCPNQGDDHMMLN